MQIKRKTHQITICHVFQHGHFVISRDFLFICLIKFIYFHSLKEKYCKQLWTYGFVVRICKMGKMVAKALMHIHMQNLCKRCTYPQKLHYFSFLNLRRRLLLQKGRHPRLLWIESWVPAAQHSSKSSESNTKSFVISGNTIVIWRLPT